MPRKSRAPTAVRRPAPPTSYTEFEFDLPTALRDQLLAAFEKTRSCELTSAIAGRVPNAQGVYQLYHDNKLVYVGKTDGQAGLRVRLTRHARKILHRPSLKGRVRFKAVRVMVFTAMDLETLLIEYYRAKGEVEWNGSGFGSNDQGVRRETTTRKEDGFDTMFPISIDEPLELPTVAPGETVAVATVLDDVREALPYTLRWQKDETAGERSRRPHPDLKGCKMLVPDKPHTVRVLVKAAVDSLGPEWHGTKFDSHVILYKENVEYKHGTRI